MPNDKLKKYKENPLPDGRRWDSLLLVTCARCGEELLSETDEHLREETGPQDDRGALGCHALLPKPIAMRAGGRPYCQRCVDKPVKFLRVPA